MKNVIKVPYDIIVKAIDADEQALGYVLNTFAPYIRRLSSKGYYDELGIYRVLFDEDLEAYIQSRLILEIVHSFKILPQRQSS